MLLKPISHGACLLSRPSSSIFPSNHPWDFLILWLFTTAWDILPSFSATVSWISYILIHLYLSIYIFHAFKPHCYFSILYHICFSSDIFDYPIHCHHINHISSLCFSISSSSNTPLSIALQAEDERTLLVMVEQRRSPDALDRPSPFISLVPDAV